MPRVYARVRTAGGGQLHLLPQQAGEQGLQLLLNAVVCIPLPLPAGIAAAVIAEAEFEIANASSLLSSCILKDMAHILKNPAV